VRALKKPAALTGRGKPQGADIVAVYTSSGLAEWYRAHRKTGSGLGIVLIITLAVIVPVAVYHSLAVTGAASVEPENGTITAAASAVTDSTASGGKSVKFAGNTTSGNSTLPPGAALPDDATCSARVTAAAEVRPQNATQNATAGHNKGLNDPGGPLKSRVDGAYTGTTDQIIQWVACKWGIDVDIVRAQAAKESYWVQSTKGDWTTDPNSCPPAHPLGADGTPGQCPESYGLLQDRWNYLGPPAGLNTWPEVETSTAYNADLAYSSWRDCFEGHYGWLNTVDRVGTYAAGDAWGCVGVWFSGRWHTSAAEGYISAVQGYYNQKIWTTSSFITYRGN